MIARRLARQWACVFLALNVAGVQGSRVGAVDPTSMPRHLGGRAIAAPTSWNPSNAAVSDSSAASIGSSAFNGHPAAVPGVIQAADFDDGGQGVAYFDTTLGNLGGEYRATDVDITTSSDGGYLVGWIDPGEWLNYTVNVSNAGAYTARFRVAALGQGGTFHLEALGTNLTGPIQIPDTGDWQTLTTVTAASNVTLAAGPQVLRLVFDAANGGVVGNVAWFSLTPVGSGSTPYQGAPAALPGTIHVENFDDGGEGIAYHDTTAGNSGGVYRDTDVDIEASSLGGYDVGWIADGEWLAYSVNVAAAGAYTLDVRAASPYSGGQLHITFGSTSIGAVSIPATGDWQAWATVTIKANLEAGPQLMKVIVDTGGFNVADITVSAQGGGGGPNDTITVPDGGDLQDAINRAQPGSTILLTAGATYTGNFVLPVKGGSSYVTIRSAAPDSALPGATRRMDPGFASLLPKLKSPNSGPALATAPGAHHYRLMFLEFLPTYQGYYDILDLGDGSDQQNAPGLVPHDLIVDRVYIHGDPTYGQKRGIGLNSASTSVLNSYIADIKAVGMDSQAICGWNGPGPYTITNNYIEAAGENVMFGGSDPAIPNLVPSDITFSDNFLTKQTAWRTQNWVVKNLLELKNVQRMVVDGNVLENNWAAAQTGYAVLFTPRNQGGTAPWSVVQHVRFINNVVRHVSSGLNILGRDDEQISQLTNDLVIQNNLFLDVNGANWGGDGRFMLITGGLDITVDHNTVFQDGASALFAYGDTSQHFIFTNNIVPDYAYAILGSDVAPGNATISAYFPDGQFRGGVYAGSNATLYPIGNFYPHDMNAVGFADLAEGNYRLAFTSPYRGAATDGTDIGCHIDVLNSSTGLNY